MTRQSSKPKMYKIPADVCKLVLDNEQKLHAAVAKEKDDGKRLIMESSVKLMLHCCRRGEMDSLDKQLLKTARMLVA